LLFARTEIAMFLGTAQEKTDCARTAADSYSAAARFAAYSKIRF